MILFQEHDLSLIGSAGCMQPHEIDPAGHLATAVVVAQPHGVVSSRIVAFMDERANLGPTEIVDLDAHRAWA